MGQGPTTACSQAEELEYDWAQTWKATGAVGLARPARLPAGIEEDLSGQIDQFIEAYLSANPK
jgi:hypothetical protein